jgi:hypothetical protein
MVRWARKANLEPPLREDDFCHGDHRDRWCPVPVKQKKTKTRQSFGASQQPSAVSPKTTSAVIREFADTSSQARNALPGGTTSMAVRRKDETAIVMDPGDLSSSKSREAWQRQQAEHSALKGGPSTS